MMQSEDAMTVDVESAPPKILGRYKVVLVGDSGVGKSSYVSRVATGEFQQDYAPTVGVHRTLLRFQTNLGPVEFDVWDVAGRPEFRALVEGSIIGAQAAIIMFDVSAGESHANVPAWHRTLSRIAENIPTVVCGNKIDQPLRFHAERTAGLLYSHVSASSGERLTTPFLMIVRALMGINDIEFIGEPHPKDS